MPETIEDVVASALAHAASLAAGAPYSAPPCGRSWRVTCAVGDPQAPLETFLTVLAAHGLLGGDGRLQPDVRVISMGDHFDWGQPDERPRAAYDGVRLLAWLASHPADQVITLAGNHDLARVGELVDINDEQWTGILREADAGYRARAPWRPEAEFAADAGLPTWEFVSRDVSAFRPAQREWVTALLRAGRLRLAWAQDGTLFTHAGISSREVDLLGLAGEARRDPAVIAAALEARWATAIRRWQQGPLVVPGLHEPGSGEGEGAGMLFQRFGRDGSSEVQLRASGVRRRASVAELPAGLCQAIGHVRDAKARALLGLAADGAELGRARTLLVGPGDVSYQHGIVHADGAQACVWQLDGGMAHADPLRYELFDVGRRALLARDERRDVN